MLKIIGEKFGRLKVISEFRNDKKKLICECVCDCGNKKIISRNNLITGHTQSCGCLVKEGTRTTHGLRKHPLYNVWGLMRDRCNNPDSTFFQHYGGRGIKVCDRWNEFENFYEDMKDGYKKGLSIDRIDNNGDYEPSNCRWATPKEQARNTRANYSVLSLDDEGNHKEYKHLMDVYHEDGYSHSNVWANIQGKIPSAYGKQWYRINEK